MVDDGQNQHDARVAQDAGHPPHSSMVPWFRTLWFKLFSLLSCFLLVAQIGNSWDQLRQLEAHARRHADDRAVAAVRSTAAGVAAFAEHWALALAILMHADGDDARARLARQMLQRHRAIKLLHIVAQRSGALEPSWSMAGDDYPAAAARRRVASDREFLRQLKDGVDVRFVRSATAPTFSLAVRFAAAGSDAVRWGVLTFAETALADAFPPLGGSALVDDQGVIAARGLSTLPENIVSHRLSPAPYGVRIRGGRLEAFCHVRELGVTMVRIETPASVGLATRVLTSRGILLGGALLAFALAVAFIAARRVTRRLGAVVRQTARIGTGDFSGASGMRGQDEIAVLSRSIAFMAGRLAEQMRVEVERVRLASEFGTAKAVQDMFLASNRTEMGRYAIDVRRRQAAACTGDWWSYFPCPGGAYVLAGKVSGQGVPAALVTAMTLALSTTLLRADPGGAVADPAHLLACMHRFFGGLGRRDATITVCVVRIDGDTGLAHVATAGHPMPLFLRRAAQGAAGVGWRALRPQPAHSSPLGEGEPEGYETHSVTFTSGDRLILATADCLGTTGWSGQEGEGGAASPPGDPSHIQDIERFLAGVIEGSIGKAAGLEGADGLTVVTLEQLTAEEPIELRSA